MFARGKPTPSPSDGEAREKLALYVYEYLFYVGAKNAAQTFLQEIRWEKNNISLGESPGFLQSWWSVFWDLYCAAPERRDKCEHSNEAKAFHEYVNPTFPPNGFGHGPPGPGGPPPGSMPGLDGMPQSGPGPFIHFGAPGMPPGQMPPMNNCIDARAGMQGAGGAGPSPAPMGPGGPMSGMMPPGAGPQAHPRMGAGTPPVAPPPSAQQPSRVPPNYAAQMNSSPIGPPVHPGMSPLPGGPGRQWPGGQGVSMPGNAGNYTSASPVQFGGAPGSVPGATGPGTPGSGGPGGGPPGGQVAMMGGPDMNQELFLRQLASGQAPGQQPGAGHNAGGPGSQMQFLGGGGAPDGQIPMGSEMTHLLNNG